MAKTRAEMLTILRDILNEPTAIKWSDNTLYTYLQRGQIKVSNDLEKSYTKDATTNSVAGTQEYILPAYFKDLFGDSRYVEYADTNSSVFYPMKRELHDLIEIYGTELDDTTASKRGTPTYFYIRDNKKIGFYPIPDYSGTNNISIHYYSYPIAMSATVDFQLPDECDYAVAYWAAKLAWEKLNTPFNQVMAQTAMDCERKYREAIEDIFFNSTTDEGSEMDYLNNNG